VRCRCTWPLPNGLDGSMQGRIWHWAPTATL
jgi:hypothetical protein